MDHLLSLLPPFILIFYFSPPKLFLSSSVVRSRDAGGTLVLVFIPTWLTTILTLTPFLCNVSNPKRWQCFDSAPIDLLITKLEQSSRLFKLANAPTSTFKKKKKIMIANCKTGLQERVSKPSEPEPVWPAWPLVLSRLKGWGGVKASTAWVPWPGPGQGTETGR